MGEHANDGYQTPTSATTPPPGPPATFAGPVEAPDAVDDGPTLEDLKAEAQELDIKGRSSMNKDELAAAIAAAKS